MFFSALGTAGGGVSVSEVGHGRGRRESAVIPGNPGRNGGGSGAKRDSASLESAIPSGAVYRISGSGAGMGTAGFAGMGK